MSNYDSIRIDQIADMGAKPEEGRFVARLSDVKPMRTKTDNHYPMVITVLEIMRGEWEGAEIGKISVLNVSKDKKGRVTAGGIMDLKRTFANVGRPLPVDYAFPLDENAAAALVKQKLGGLLLDISVSPDKKNPQYTRVQINGVAGESSSDADFEDFDGEYEDVA